MLPALAMMTYNAGLGEQCSNGLFRGTQRTNCLDQTHVEALDALSHAAGLSEDVITMLKCLEKTFPEEATPSLPMGQVVFSLGNLKRSPWTGPPSQNISEQPNAQSSRYLCSLPQSQVLGAKAPKKQRTVAEDATEILEASHYEDLKNFAMHAALSSALRKKCHSLKSTAF